MRRVVPLLGKLFGAGLFANGLYMLADPVNWYFAVPGVTSSGAFNQHFVRDIGMTFLLVGIGFILGAILPVYRVLLWAASTLWLTGHATVHMVEIAAGICGPSKLLTDLPGVFVPAILGWAMSIWANRSKQR